MARNENMIAALKRERASYEARGLTDRVAMVDEQLRFYGEDPETSQGGAETSEAKVPRGRQARPRQQQG